MLSIWKQVVYGITWGGSITFIALTILVINDIESSVMTIWLSMGGSIFLGIYFGLAAYIFTVDQWSPLKKTIIHFVLSLTVYFIVAFTIGWVPFNGVSIIISTIIFSLIYMLFWFGYNLYFRKLTATLNETLEKRKDK